MLQRYSLFMPSCRSVRSVSTGSRDRIVVHIEVGRSRAQSDQVTHIQVSTSDPQNEKDDTDRYICRAGSVRGAPLNMRPLRIDVLCSGAVYTSSSTRLRHRRARKSVLLLSTWEDVYEKYGRLHGGSPVALMMHICRVDYYKIRPTRASLCNDFVSPLPVDQAD